MSDTEINEAAAATYPGRIERRPLYRISGSATALEYLQALDKRPPAGPSATPAASSALTAAETEAGPLAEGSPASPATAGQLPAGRSPTPGIDPPAARPAGKAEMWLKIEIIPDVRLEVKGNFNDHQLRRLEIIAGEIRQKLLEGHDD